MTIKITPIGSCRIHNPFKKFNSNSHVYLNTADSYGFTHTSAEALQQLKYLQGEYLPSKAIHPILSSRLRFKKEQLRLPSAPSDLYFIEISSAKTAMVGEEYVQMNYIYVYFSEFFLEACRTRKFWSLAARPSSEELLNFLEDIPVYKAYPQEKKILLSRIRVKQMTEAELKQDMLEISNRVKHAVFITHCNVKLPDMNTISSRERWIHTIEKIGKEIECRVYNPTHLMIGLGQSFALQKNGLDSTHYTSLFENKIFNDLQRLYIDPLLQGFSKEASAQMQLPVDELSRLETLFNQGEIIQLLQQLNTITRNYPQIPSAKELLGKALYQTHDYERVIELLNQLDENQDLSNEGRLILIKSYAQLKQFAEVLNHASLFFEEEVYEPEVIKLSAMACQALGYSEKASIYWEQLYKFETFRLEAACQQALLFEQKNEFDNAIKWINLALEISPSDLKLRSALNRMLATVADEKSLECLIEKVSPISEDEILSIAMTALNHNFILAAAKSLHKAHLLWPSHPSVKKMIATTSTEWLNVIRHVNSQSTVWLDHLRGLLLIQPRQNVAIRIRRDFILNQRTALKLAYKNSDYDKAIAAGMNIHCLDPNFAGISLLIGRCFYAKNIYTQSLIWLMTATLSDSRDKNAWALRAKAALRANDFTQAILTIQQLKASLPDDEQSTEINNIIKLVIREALKEINRLQDKEELELAWQLLEPLLVDSPEDKKILRTKKSILKNLAEQLKEAESSDIQIKLARSLYQKDPNHIQALRILALSLMKQKKLEESLSFWEKLCILSPGIDSYKMQAQKCLKSEGLMSSAC